MYLSREAVLSTLGYVAERPPGGSITFDYLVPPGSLPILKRIGFFLLARRVAAAGEPFRTWFHPAELDRTLRGLGFTRLEDLSSDALDERYFQGRADRLRGRGASHVVTATV